MAKKELVKAESNGLVPMDQIPDYLRDEKVQGLEGLDQSDFKMPRVKVLQSNSPEIRSFPGVAIPGTFWHTAASISLGDSFTFVPCVAAKRVILWSKRDTGAEMLAFSKDGKKWDMGGNQVFEIKIKGRKDPILIDTKDSVANSKLLEWGSSDPDDIKSPPAATLIYEYLMYFPSMPELSPCLFGGYRTAVNNMKKLNTSLLMLRKPLASVAVNCFMDEMSDDSNTWYVPNFKLAGYVPREVYDTARAMGEEYAHYTAEYVPESSERDTSPVGETTAY